MTMLKRVLRFEIWDGHVLVGVGPVTVTIGHERDADDRLVIETSLTLGR